MSCAAIFEKHHAERLTIICETVNGVVSDERIEFGPILPHQTPSGLIYGTNRGKSSACKA